MGGDLWRTLHTKGPFNDNVARFYVACVIEAFDYLHKRQFVYRWVIIVKYDQLIHFCQLQWFEAGKFNGRQQWLHSPGWSWLCEENHGWTQDVDILRYSRIHLPRLKRIFWAGQLLTCYFRNHFKHWSHYCCRLLVTRYFDLWAVVKENAIPCEGRLSHLWGHPSGYWKVS